MYLYKNIPTWKIERYELQNKQEASAHTKSTQTGYKTYLKEFVPVTTTLLITTAMTSVSTPLLRSQQN